MIAWMSQTSVFISAGKNVHGALPLGPQNYTDAHMALILWWHCNYINYSNNLLCGGYPML